MSLHALSSEVEITVVIDALMTNNYISAALYARQCTRALQSCSPEFVSFVCVFVCVCTCLFMCMRSCVGARELGHRVSRYSQKDLSFLLFLFFHSHFTNVSS